LFSTFPAERQYGVLEIQAGQSDKGLTELVSCELHIVGKVNWLAINDQAADVITPLMSYADVEPIEDGAYNTRTIGSSAYAPWFVGGESAAPTL
jgi:hypothetical protein